MNKYPGYIIEMSLTPPEMLFLITHYKFSKTHKINMELLKTFNKEHLQFIMRLHEKTTEKSKEFLEYIDFIQQRLSNDTTSMW